jgi:hypothetical protein
MSTIVAGELHGSGAAKGASGERVNDESASAESADLRLLLSGGGIWIVVVGNDASRQAATELPHPVAVEGEQSANTSGGSATPRRSFL